MSYREENGQVILTMSAEDYETILAALATFTAPALAEFMRNGKVGGLERMLSLLNRLNSGNPNYTPYQVEAEKK